VKSPVASLCFVCSSVKNRVRVMMSVLTASPLLSPLPLDAILSALRLNAVPSSLLRELYAVVFEHNGERDKDGVWSEEGEKLAGRCWGSMDKRARDFQYEVRPGSQVGRIGAADHFRYLFGTCTGWMELCPRQWSGTSSRYFS
jgi:hypothetical protein